MLALAVLTVVKRGMVIEIIAPLTAIVPGVTPGLVLCAALTALASMNDASAATVSLEGKTLWIARSLPADARDVLVAKVLMHMLVCGLPAAVAAVVCSAALALDFKWLLLSLAAPLSYTAFIAFTGVALNLLFPKLEWINELQPAKQGISTLLTLFGGMAVLAMLALLYIFVLSPLLGAEVYILVCSALFICGSAALHRYLTHGGARRFERL
jgi:ABC-2 type transport system permease protein